MQYLEFIVYSLKALKTILLIQPQHTDASTRRAKLRQTEGRQTSLSTIILTVIDEANIKYKGRTSLKQYMPMKPIKRGVKMLCRADSTNGNLCEFDIYTGKCPQGIKHGLGYSVVTHLYQHNIKGKWYAIFCDNFFTTYRLVYRDKILCCSTLRSGHQKFPPCLFDKEVIKTMRRADVFWRMKGPVLAQTLMDKKPVHGTGVYAQAPAENLPEVNRN